MENNMFYVKPASLLDALAYGVQGYNQARKSAKEDETKLGRQRALERLNSGDVQGAFAETLGIGDTDGAKAVATYADNSWNRKFRESEAARQESQWKATHGLQRAQLQATVEGQRMSPGFARQPDGSVSYIPGGPADPSYLARVTEAKKVPETFDNEQKLRKEFEGNAKTHLETRRGYERVLASKDDPAGDISLIFGYMKMLDPGSVVREGEFATAQNAAGIPDQIRNAYNRALEGTRLNPSMRTMFKGQAGALYETSKREYSAREKQMRGIAQQFGLNPDRIIPSLGDGPAGVNPGAANIPPPPPGFNLVK